MDKFRNTIKNRAIWTGVGVAIVAVVMVFVILNITLATHEESFIEGYQVGVGSAALAISIVGLVKYIGALRNPEKLKKLYVTETDERNKFVAEKANAGAMSVSIFGLFIAALIAGVYNADLFFVLLEVLAGIVFVVFCFKVYYRTKY